MDNEYMTGIEQAYNAFINSTDFEEAIRKSTKSSWSGSGCLVELFSNGSYRVLNGKDVGSLYDSPDMLISLSAVNDEELDDNEEDWYLDNAKDSFMITYQNLKLEYYDALVCD